MNRAAVRGDERQAEPAVLAVVRAFLAAERRQDRHALHAPALDHVLRLGLGPVLAWITPGICDAMAAERIQAADLTARAVAADKYDTLAEVLVSAEDIAAKVVLLKGIATALRYYPAPHLRKMEDIDILVEPDQQPAIEAALRARGFAQPSAAPASASAGLHHSVPFRYGERGAWVEVHSRLSPPGSPHAQDPQFSWPLVSSQLTEVTVGGRRAFVMNHELQLVYTCARWAEEFTSRGLFPILDVALLLRKHGEILEWERVVRMVERSWTASAVHLMLFCVHRWGLAPIPFPVLERLAAADRHLNWLSLRLLHRVVTRHVIEGRTFGRAVGTEGHVQVLWSSLLGARSPAANLLAFPYRLAFPPGRPDRFTPKLALLRARRFLRRAWPARG
jgi:hypothetical protein